MLTGEPAVAELHQFFETLAFAVSDLVALSFGADMDPAGGAIDGIPE